MRNNRVDGERAFPLGPLAVSFPLVVLARGNITQKWGSGMHACDAPTNQHLSFALRPMYVAGMLHHVAPAFHGGACEMTHINTTWSIAAVFLNRSSLSSECPDLSPI